MTAPRWNLPRCAAILACVIAASAQREISASAIVQLPRTQGVLAIPIEVRARTAAGGTLAGTLQSWDLQTLSGSFGTRRWTDLSAADLQRIFLQVMDRKDAAQMLALAELLASCDDGIKLAQERFRVAKQLGATDEAIDAARTRARGAVVARTEEARAEEQRRLKPGAAPKGATTNGAPTAGAAPVVPWPIPTDAQRAAALARVREAAMHALEIAGVAGQQVETTHFLLAGDLPAGELQRTAEALEAAYARTLAALGVPADANLFCAKTLVLAFAKEDTFAVTLAGVHQRKAAPGQRSAFQPDAVVPTILAFRGNDELALTTELLRAGVQAMLYRHMSQQPLPEWAAEGFADWITRGGVAPGHMDGLRRPSGLAFFRQGGDATTVMAMRAADGSWPGERGIGLGVAYLLVELMIAEQPQRFAAWVRAVKSGKGWEEALVADFGLSPAQLAQGAAHWYRTNDGVIRR